MDPDPALYDELLDEKVRRVKHLLGGRLQVPLDVFASQPLHHRMKVIFALENTEDDLRFKVCDVVSRHSVFVDRYPIASEPLESLMVDLREALLDSPEMKQKAFTVEMLTNTVGDALVCLSYHRPLQQEAFLPAAEALAARLRAPGGVTVVGRSHKKRIVANGPGHLVQTHEVGGKVYPQCHQELMFSQSNAGICTKMLQWAATQTRPKDGESVEDQGDLLELHCGNGNFTLPLSANFREVVATETVKQPTKFARQCAREAGVENVKFVRLCAAEASMALKRDREFTRLANAGVDLDALDLRTVFVDPPRQGLDEPGLDVVRRFPRCLYVSCCPEKLLADLENLPDYEVTTAAFFDQFPYTEHAEVAVVLERVK